MKRLLVSMALLAFASLTMLGCTKSSSTSDDGTSTSSVTLAGTLGSVATLSKVTPFSYSQQSVSVTDLEVYGLAFTAVPQIKKQELGADGSFSLTFTDAADAAISLVFRNKTSLAEVGLVKFEDTTKKDLAGNNQKSTSISLKAGSVSLGTLAINSDGEVVVPVSRITTNISTVPTTVEKFDFTGSWKVAAYDGTLPEGYTAACAAGTTDCHGPAIDEPLYLLRMEGTGWANGAATSDEKYGIQIWSSETAFNNCGRKLGFTLADGRNNGGVDVATWAAANNIIEDEYTWDSGWTDGWKSISAKAQYDIQTGCYGINKSVNGRLYNGWRCVDGDGTISVSLGGGCHWQGETTPVDVRDWSSITNGTYETLNITDLPTGFTAGRNTYTNVTVSGHTGTLVCDWADGVFTAFDDDTWTNTTTDRSNFDYNSIPVEHAGADCSSIVGELAQARCYLEYYHNQEDTLRRNSTCVRNIQANYNAKTVNDFISDNGPRRSVNTYMISLFEYSPDGSGSFGDENVYYAGVQGNNSWIPCKVAEMMHMSVKKVSDTKLLLDFETKVRLLDTGVDACVAAAESGTLSAGISKSLVYLNKQ